MNIAANKSFWTEEVFRIHGMTSGDTVRDADNAISESLALYHPEDRIRVEQSFRRCVEDGVPFVIEARLITPAGCRKWVESRGERIVDDNGEYHVVGYLSDISDLKRKEEAIRKGEEKYRTILQTAMDGFWITDMKGRLLEVNDAYCHMSGYSEKELLAMKISQLEGNMCSTEILGKIDEILKKGAVRFETCHKRKDGSLYDVEVSAQTTRSSRK